MVNRDRTSFKNKAIELDGISDSTREERGRISVCLKCGKGGHTCYNYRSKNPIIEPVLSVPKVSKRKWVEDHEGTLPVGKRQRTGSTKVRPIEISQQVEPGDVIPL